MQVLLDLRLHGLHLLLVPLLRAFAMLLLAVVVVHQGAEAFLKVFWSIGEPQSRKGVLDVFLRTERDAHRQESGLIREAFEQLLSGRLIVDVLGQFLR